MPKITGRGHEEWTKTPDGWSLRVRWSYVKGEGGYGIVSKSFHGPTKSDCRAQAEEHKRHVSHGSDPRGGRLTVREYSDMWLTACQDAGLRESTLKNYRTNLKHVLQHVGSTRLDELSSATWRTLENGLREDGRRPHSVHWALRVLRQIVRSAVRDGLIPYDPMATQKLPIKTHGGTRRALSAQDAAKLRDELHAAPFDIRLVPSIVMIGIGCRLGEAIALTWGDIDLGVTMTAPDGTEHHLCRISIDKQWTYTDGTHDTKTERGKRVAWGDDVLDSWLSAWKADRASKGLAFDSCPIAPYHDGHVSPVTARRTFKDFAAAHGFPGLLPHELRHTVATIKLAAGVDVKSIQAAGGWSSAAVLLDIYSHPVDYNVAMGAVAMAEAMSKSCQKESESGRKIDVSAELSVEKCQLNGINAS